MTRRTLESLPDDARLWLLVLNQPLEGTALAQFEAGLEEAVSAWRHKGTAYEGAWSVREGQLVLVAEPTMATQPSGCAIEGLMRKVDRLVAQAQVDLVPDGPVVACTCDGLAAFDRSDLAQALGDGRLHARTPILDRTLFTLGDLRTRGLTQELQQTWIGRKFGLLQAV